MELSRSFTVHKALELSLQHPVLMEQQQLINSRG